MERGSLYDLMNSKLNKLECDEEFNDLHKFITNDKSCIKFIRALTDGFGVDETDVEIFKSAQARARHSVVTFLMGLVFSNFAGIYDSISSIVNEDNNLELWLLTSLNHDQGYYSKYLKNEKLDYKKHLNTICLMISTLTED